MGVSHLFSPKILTKFFKEIYTYENHNISKADVLLFLCDPLPWLEAFKCLYQSHCTDWGHLNV